MGIGTKKAAMLLASLDSATASELLKDQPQEIIHELAMELSRIEAADEYDEYKSVGIAKEFCTSLAKLNSGGIHIRSFVDSILKSTGSKNAEMHAEMKKALQEKDPFLAISNASPAHIAAALEGESAQAVAMVLSSIPPNLSTEVLARIDDEVSTKAVWRMTMPIEASPKTMRRVGEMICKRLVELTSDNETVAPVADTQTTQTLRQVAIVLSGLDKDKREAMLDEIDGNDSDTAKMIKSLMVTWEDIPKVEDRSLQEVLRKVEAGILAKALFNAEPIIAEKIRANISERAAEMVDEESSLMSEPRKKEVMEAREEVAKPLREANEAEELLFIEE